MTPTIDALDVADDAAGWTEAGFTVTDDGTCRIGSVRVRLLGRDDDRRGIVGWSLRDVPDGWTDDTIDGFPTRTTQEPPAAPAEHPNGATHIDHLVLLAPHAGRAVAAIEATGLSVRRRRDHVTAEGQHARQVFFRLGEVILEVVSPAEEPAPGSEPGPSRAFGLTLTVDDIDSLAERLGSRLGPVRPAVQPGRHIATLRHRDLGLTTAIAFMTPDPRRR